MPAFLFSLLLFCLPTSLYTLNLTTAAGGTVSLSSLQGKKLLLVNVATGSPRAAQLGQLEQLRSLYGDSLAVIAFPSNSFGHEPKTDAEIKSFCEATYHAHFLIAQKGQVTGPGKQAVYAWLTNRSENGVMGGEVKADFQKFLVDRDGQLIGVFAGSVSPLDQQIKDAVTGAQ